MRYQNILLPALASLVFADDVAVAANPAATPDALPLDDLRDIPVPTYTIATGVTKQDIPYATSAAIADVAAEVAATPLSVFPAATDVPINAAGKGDTTGSESDANSNVITSTGSKLKRAMSGVTRQLRYKRGNCNSEPTLPNTYNVNLVDSNAFKTDANIAATANNANAAPAGYYQNFKNKQGANSAMNYLGYSVVQTGYDVDWCAKQCDAKGGCLSFNIYFERDPTLNPGSGCENPDAFANIKCSFWGTGLDESTATNVGQWREKFWVSIAGSNAYTSYKLGGPVDSWNGPQKLGNAALNAPLWDCENKWSYLGYKLLQAGSVDPRLCAAACDTQTAFNKAHPAGADPYACNAFGSYILTKKNSTGSYQQGQMCTFYTAYWDAKYAKNTGASDPAIGATYSYSFSTFYGKTGAQLSCPADYQSSSGTFVKGGVDKKASIQAASSAILASSLQQFCSSLLGYTIPATTVTATATTTPIISTTITITAVVTTTAAVNVKRDDAESSAPVVITTNGVLMITLMDPSASQTLVARAAASTPDALIKYSGDVVTSACSLAATSATSTSTVTVTATVTAPAEEQTEVITATSTQTVSSTTTTSVATPSCVPVNLSASDSVYNTPATTLCDKTIESAWNLLTTYQPGEVSNVRDCLKAMDGNNFGFGMTFDLDTKQCVTYGLKYGSPGTVQTKLGVVFGYRSNYGTLYNLNK
jgi:hypothetical protein